MRQRWAILGYAACVAAVLGALAWVTVHTLRLERMEVVARADARLQESIRLVLWRMDSTLTPIIAREAARPYFEYQSFYSADRALAGAGKGAREQEVLVPSPLLQTPEPYVRVYYQQDVEGLSSPQVPEGAQRTLAEPSYATGYSIEAAKQQLERLEPLLGSRAFAGAVFGGVDAGIQQIRTPIWSAVQSAELLSADRSEGLQGAHDAQQAQRESMTLNDYQARQTVTDLAKNIGDNRFRNTTPQRAAAPPVDVGVVTAAASDKKPASLPTAALDASKESPTPSTRDANDSRGDGDGARKDIDGSEVAAREKAEVRALKAVETSSVDPEAAAAEKNAGVAESIGPSVTQGQFVAHWLERPAGGEPELVFSRNVIVGERTLRQGFWLDWPALRGVLLDSARDLLPRCSLRPVTGPADGAVDQAALSRTLAAIPAELVLPAWAPPSPPAWSPARTVIAVTWLAVLLAILATGLVLRASMELAERRGRFVSAVTHELRTPLTTFCLYSQMLADGMVKDEGAQKGYFETLKSESQRLARIVESVLDYARLSGRRTAHHPLTTSVHDLVGPLLRPLVARCEQAGVTLEVEGDMNDARPITTDPAIVERVIYNLVDNACKYAADAEEQTIRLTVEAGDREVAMTVRDHGPGIDPGESARLFRPFVRGARHGHGSIPGLGLGLAIAKGLARELGGDLELVPNDQGAAFRLRLPRRCG